MTLSSFSKFIYSLGFNKVNFDVHAVMEATKLKNFLDQEPKAIATTKTPKGWSLVFVLPPGIGIKEFEDRRKYFQAYTNSIVEFTQHGRRLTMDIYNASFPKRVPYHFQPDGKMIAPVPIGIGMDGKVIIVDLADLPHMLIGGMTGYGKTTEMIVFLVSLLQSEVEISVIDRKRVDFPQFIPWIKVALTEEETGELLDEHIAEMNKRLDRFSKIGVQKFSKYKGKDLKYKVLLVDEITEIETKENKEKIEKLGFLSRASGMSLILATQKPAANIWDGFSNLRSQLAGRLCFYVADSTDSQVVLGKGNTKGAELPMIKGRAIWNNDNDQMVQAMYLESDTAVEILDKLIPRRVKNEQPIIRIPT